MACAVCLVGNTGLIYSIKYNYFFFSKYRITAKRTSDFELETDVSGSYAFTTSEFLGLRKSRFASLPLNKNSQRATR